MVDVPAGMRPVSKDEFFRALYADPRDIMPNCQRTFTPWKVVRTGEPWGWSAKGYANHGDPEQYALALPAKAKP